MRGPTLLPRELDILRPGKNIPKELPVARQRGQDWAEAKPPETEPAGREGTAVVKVAEAEDRVVNLGSNLNALS